MVREATKRLDDQAFVEGLIEGNDSTVVAFLDRYRPLLAHCISSFEPDSSARDDLEQELVCYIIDRLRRDRFDPDKGTFATWLYRVAWCRCVDLKRRERARQPPVVATPETMPEHEDLGPGPGEVAGSEEVGEEVRRALRELEPGERSLLELRFLQSRTLSEVADACNITLEQAKYRLRRAQISMRRVLLRRFKPAEVHEA